MLEPLTLAEIRDAAALISSHVVTTPVVTSPELDRMVGATVLCKVEGQQRSGSFKFRGAFNRLRRIPEEDRSSGVVAVSSGNHGAAVACSSDILDLDAVVFIPKDAPARKRALIEEYGAEVVPFDRFTDDREALAARRVAESGATFVHPYEDRFIMAGQGTTALELHDQVGPLDQLLVPMSGGGLMAGCGTVMHALDPGCALFGVEPALGDDTRRSLEQGRIVTIDQPDTMADGLAVVSPGVNTFAINSRLLTGVLTVTEDRIAEAMVLVRETLGLLIEPSGAVGIAALMDSVAQRETGAPPRVGVVLSGANIDEERFTRLTSN